MQMPPGTVQSNGNFAAKVQEYMEFLPDKQKKKKKTNKLRVHLERIRFLAVLFSTICYQFPDPVHH